MEIDRLLIQAQINLGISAIGFMDSELGQYLIGAAQQEVNELSAQLINETDVKIMRKLQADIKCRQMALSWIHELIQLGVEAKQLEEETNE